jgi:flagellar M-ring protein FliF
MSGDAMNALAQAKRIWANLMALGPKRLAALALVGALVFAFTGLAGWWLSRPTHETLYSGLDRDDVVSIGSALQEAGVAFDVAADGTAVLTPVGQTAQARMILAQKGLPHSGNVGDELYDKLGSLGLTSFMQEVTRVRALEGELARTIQMMRGIKAARVHVVLGDEGSFRRERQPPSASVIIRGEGLDAHATGLAIRKLVAAAVPGMKPEEVTVLDVDGQLLAAGSDSMENAPDNLLALQNSVSHDIRDSITRTLSPYLNPRNFQVSVAARLNADKTQTSETVYDPEKSAQRSVRVTKEKLNSQNSAGAQPAGVQANLPKPQTGGGDTKNSQDSTDKKEELTNFEVSSRSVTVTSQGFTVKGLSVALLINRAALAATLGDKPDQSAIDKAVKDIEALASEAAGLDKARGDTIKIAVVEFADASKDMEPVSGPSILEILERQLGTILSALAVLAVGAMMVLFGVKPLVGALLAAPAEGAATAAAAAEGSAAALEGPGFEMRNAFGDDAPDMNALGGMGGEDNLLLHSSDSRDEFLDALRDRRNNGVKQKLQKLVDFDEEQAARVLKEWIKQGAGA